MAEKLNFLEQDDVDAVCGSRSYHFELKSETDCETNNQIQEDSRSLSIFDDVSNEHFDHEKKMQIVFIKESNTQNNSSVPAVENKTITVQQQLNQHVDACRDMVTDVSFKEPILGNAGNSPNSIAPNSFENVGIINNSPTEMEVSVSNDPSIELYLGQKFESFEALLTLLKKRRLKYGEAWVRGSTNKPRTPHLKNNERVKHKLIYSRLQMRCRHSGTPKHSGRGIRNFSSIRQNCPVEILLRLDKAGEALVVKLCSLEHNHSLDRDLVYKRPRECLNAEQLEELSQLRSVGLSVKKIRDFFVKKYNIQLLPTDLYNFFHLQKRKLKNNDDFSSKEVKELPTEPVGIGTECETNHVDTVFTESKADLDKKPVLINPGKEENLCDDPLSNNNYEDYDEEMDIKLNFCKLDEETIKDTILTIHERVVPESANNLEKELREFVSANLSSFVQVFDSQYQVTENSKVYYVTEVKCTCSFFISLLLPCRHIYAVRHFANLPLFHSEEIPDKYLLTNNNERDESGVNMNADESEKLRMISQVCFQIAQTASSLDNEKFMDVYSTLVYLKEMWEKGHSVQLS